MKIAVSGHMSSVGRGQWGMWNWEAVQVFLCREFWKIISLHRERAEKRDNGGSLLCPTLSFQSFFSSLAVSMTVRLPGDASYRADTLLLPFIWVWITQQSWRWFLTALSWFSSERGNLLLCLPFSKLSLLALLSSYKCFPHPYKSRWRQDNWSWQALGGSDGTEVSLRGYIPHLVPNFFQGGQQCPLPSYMWQGNWGLDSWIILLWVTPFSFTGVSGSQGLAYTNSRKLVWVSTGKVCGDTGAALAVIRFEVWETEYGWLSRNPCAHSRNMELALIKSRFCRLGTENRLCLLCLFPVWDREGTEMQKPAINGFLLFDHLTRGVVGSVMMW